MARRFLRSSLLEMWLSYFAVALGRRSNIWYTHWATYKAIGFVFSNAPLTVIKVYSPCLRFLFVPCVLLCWPLILLADVPSLLAYILLLKTWDAQSSINTHTCSGTGKNERDLRKVCQEILKLYLFFKVVKHFKINFSRYLIGIKFILIVFKFWIFFNLLVSQWNHYCLAIISISGILFTI